MKHNIDRLQDKYESSEASRNQLESEYELMQTKSTNLDNELSIIREQNEQLKQSNNTLQQEITNFQNQSYICYILLILFYMINNDIYLQVMKTVKNIISYDENYHKQSNFWVMNEQQKQHNKRNIMGFKQNINRFIIYYFIFYLAVLIYATVL